MPMWESPDVENAHTPSCVAAPSPWVSIYSSRLLSEAAGSRRTYFSSLTQPCHQPA